MSRAFDVAYFFHTSPLTVLDLDVGTLLEWEQQARRIAAIVRGEPE